MLNKTKKKEEIKTSERWGFFPFTEMVYLLFFKNVGFFLLFLPFIIILNSFMSLLSKITFVNKSPLFPASVVLEKIKLLRRSSFYL